MNTYENFINTTVAYAQYAILFPQVIIKCNHSCNKNVITEYSGQVEHAVQT